MPKKTRSRGFTSRRERKEKRERFTVSQQIGDAFDDDSEISDEGSSTGNKNRRMAEESDKISSSESGVIDCVSHQEEPRKRGRPSGKSRNSKFCTHNKQKNMRAQLEQRRANGQSLPTKTEYFDAINVEEFEWKPCLKCSRYKFGRHIIKARPFTLLWTEYVQSDDLICDDGVPIRLMPFYESGKAKWVGFIWKEMYLNPAFLGSLCKRAGVDYKSMEEAKIQNLGYSKEYEKFMDYINDKSRIYFVIDVVNWRGMVQPLISDFGSKEELESEDGIVGSNYESIQKFVDEYQPASTLPKSNFNSAKSKEPIRATATSKKENLPTPNSVVPLNKLLKRLFVRAKPQLKSWAELLQIQKPLARMGIPICLLFEEYEKPEDSSRNCHINSRVLCLLCERAGINFQSMDEAQTLRSTTCTEYDNLTKYITGANTNQNCFIIEYIQLKRGPFPFIFDFGSEEEIKNSLRSLQFLKSTQSDSQPQPKAMEIVDFPTFVEAEINGYTRAICTEIHYLRSVEENNWRLEMGLTLTDLEGEVELPEMALGSLVVASHETICKLLNLDSVHTLAELVYEHQEDKDNDYRPVTYSISRRTEEIKQSLIDKPLIYRINAPTILYPKMFDQERWLITSIFIP